MSKRTTTWVPRKQWSSQDLSWKTSFTEGWRKNDAKMQNCLSRVWHRHIIKRRIKLWDNKALSKQKTKLYELVLSHRRVSWATIHVRGNKGKQFLGVLSCRPFQSDTHEQRYFLTSNWWMNHLEKLEKGKWGR